MLSNESDQLKVLLQLTVALEYIHSKNFIHRDIKPENILVSIKDSVKMKWADFGHSKLTNERGSTSMSGARGTKAWLAKEIIPYFNTNELGGRCSKSSDIFAAGSVFFYFLTRGIHPFGNENGLDTIEKNILDGNIVNKSGMIWITTLPPFLLLIELCFTFRTGRRTFCQNSCDSNDRKPTGIDESSRKCQQISMNVDH